VRPLSESFGIESPEREAAALRHWGGGRRKRYPHTRFGRGVSIGASREIWLSRATIDERLDDPKSGRISLRTLVYGRFHPNFGPTPEIGTDLREQVMTQIV